MAYITTSGVIHSTPVAILEVLLNLPTLHILLENSFFTANQYEKLPSSWREALTRNELEDISQILNLEEIPRKLWPLSLLCIRRLLSSFSLSRAQTFRENHLPQKDDVTLRKTACMDHPRLLHIFVKNVKPKKRYEVRAMAEETIQLAVQSNVNWVLDVGSGVGHLCRLLSYGFGINTCGVESKEQLCEKARKLDEELESKASKHFSETEIKALRLLRPVHHAVTIGPENAVQTFIKVVTESSRSADCPNFGIVGLHPCGDLAVTLLRAFLDCPQAKFINIVGCCYSKMDFSRRQHSNYPLSSTCAQSKPNLLTTDAGGLGCHAMEVYSSRLAVGDYDNLKIHCFRAALERIIVRRWPSYEGSGLNNVRHYHGLTFPEYCKKALLKLSLTVPQEDFELQVTQEDLQSWEKVVCFYSLWLLMGPAIESIILLDRLIYLREKGIASSLKAVFNPVLSPRNLFLSGIKYG